MLSAKARSRLTVVLVGARNPQNIGAAARAMQDFGFADLRIVNPFTLPFEAAQLEVTSAVGAGEVMRAARRFDDLSTAIADCRLVAGTTAIGNRELKLPVVSLHEGAAQILAGLQQDLESTAQAEPELDPASGVFPSGSDTATALAGSEARDLTATPGRDGQARVALLFGSEKTGLTNEQLSYCSLLLTIPLFAPEGRHLSMNLGQAVAVCLYELTRGGLEGARELPVLQASAATAADRERLTQLLLETMQDSGYARRFPANARLEIVRRLAGTLGTTGEHATTWMGLFKSVLQTMQASS